MKVIQFLKVITMSFVLLSGLSCEEKYVQVDDGTKYIESPEWILENNEFVAECSVKSTDVLATLGMFRVNEATTVRGAILLAQFELIPQKVLKGDPAIQQVTLWYPITVSLVGGYNNAPDGWQDGLFLAFGREILSDDSLGLTAYPLGQWEYDFSYKPFSPDSQEVKTAAEVAELIANNESLKTHYRLAKEKGPVIYHTSQDAPNPTGGAMTGFAYPITKDDYKHVMPEDYLPRLRELADSLSREPRN